MISQKKIYITGVSGFIGSRVAARCAELGYQVVGISRDASKCSLLAMELGIQVIEADLVNLGSFALESADAVIHCATANDILSKDFNAGLALSVVGTRNLLQATDKAGIRNFIFFSTAQVYGTELTGHVDESVPVCCETPYALNHFFGEELCRMYSSTRDFNIAVLRPSNVYGVPEVSTVNRATLVPMCFVDEAMKQGSITIRSSGKQNRNFVSTDEIVELILQVLKNFPQGYSVINAGSNWCASILDVAQMVANSYALQYGKRLAVTANGSQSSTPNLFQYKSRLFTPLKDKAACKENMSHVINQLFQKWRPE